MIDSKARKKIKGLLPSDWAKIISSRTGFSEQYVRLVLRGVHSNEKIENNIFKLVFETRTKQIKAEKMLHNALSKIA